MSRNLLQGIVGAWCPSLGPSGYTLLDRSGRGTHGTLTNMAATSWISSPGGWALDFDGTNDHVPVRAYSGLTNHVTFAAWCNLREVSNFRTIISDCNSAGASINFHMETNGGKLGILWGANPYFRPQGGSISTNTWFHAVVSRSGEAGAWRARIFVNGVNVYDNTTATAIGTSNILTIGRAGEYNGLFCDGAVDDVGAWGRALTDGEVAQLYSLGRNGLGRLLTQRAQRRVFRTQAAAVKSYLVLNRGQVIGGGTL